MSEHENAPAAPPEGEAEAILRRKEVRQPCSGKRGDGPWVLVEPAIYLSVTERDTVLAALAAATARADEDEAGRLRWEQEAERLRGERADLQHKLAHWQRVAEESGTMVARRVEAMREAAAVHTQEYLVSCGVTDACDVAEEVADAIRALPAPSPGPSAEDALREWLRKMPDCPTCNGAGGFGPGGFDRQGEWQGAMCDDCGGSGKLTGLTEAEAARRVEAMRRACARKAADSVEQDADRLWDAVMSTEIPATPAPEKPMQEGGGLICPCPPCQGKPATPAPGPSAEDALRWPKADDDDAAKGWTYDPSWLARVADAVDRVPDGEDRPSLEVVENVLRALAHLATGEGQANG